MSHMKRVPEISIDVDGSPLQRQHALDISSIRIQQALSLPSQCEICFSNPRDAATLTSALIPGSQLAVRVQNHTDMLFEGEITAVEYNYGADNDRRIYVRAYDRLHRLSLHRTVVAYVNQSTQDLVQQLASSAGLAVQVHDQGPVFQRVVQYQQTDLDFLRQQTERVGLYYHVRGSSLQLMSLQGSGNAITLKLGESLLEASIEINNAADCRSVETIAWDPWLLEPHQGVVDQARSGRVVGLDDTITVADGAEARVLVDQISQDDDQATAMAQAEFDRRVARRLVFSGVAEGHPGLVPGRPVNIDGVADSLSGQYILTETTHRIDLQDGYVTELKTTPPARQTVSGETTTTMAKITAVDDPESLARVRVRYSTYNDIESDWLEVLIPGAGADKGVIALPDIDDQVLVLLLDGDPAQAIVLGGLYGRQSPPDSGVQDGRVQRFNFLTPGGQRIRMDDGEETIHIENSSGSFIEISPERCRLHAESDMEIEAPGQTVTIRGQAINFERA